MIRAVVLGVAALVGAFAATVLVEESGYNCLLGHVPSDAGSVYRVLPWGQTERLFFIGHVALYPLATIIGAAAGRIRYGVKPKRSGLVLAIAAPVLTIFSFAVQARVTRVFLNLDACGAGYYEASGVVRLLGPEIAIVVVVALIAGATSWFSASPG